MTYSERIYKRNTHFDQTVRYLRWIERYDMHHTTAFNGWKFRNLQVYMNGMTHWQKRYLNNYRTRLMSKYNHPVTHKVHKHNTKKYSTRKSRKHASKAYKLDQRKSSKSNHHKHVSKPVKKHIKKHLRTRKAIKKNRVVNTDTSKPSINLSNSRVNKYIIDNDLSHAKIQHHVLTYLPHLKYRHGAGHPDGVVVHETGNPYSNIFGEINFMKHDWNNAFVHSFVDDNHIINIANTNYQAWGVAYPGNAHFLQFEQTEMHSKRAFAKEVNNAAYYTAHLLKQYHLTPKDAEYTGKGTVWSHALVAKYMGGSDHVDPVTYYANDGREFFGQPYTMRQFYQLVLHYYYK